MKMTRERALLEGTNNQLLLGVGAILATPHATKRFLHALPFEIIFVFALFCLPPAHPQPPPPSPPDILLLPIRTSFTFTITFVFLNLFIGVILDGFDAAKEESEEFITAKDLRRFADHWANFDPHATCLISVQVRGQATDRLYLRRFFFVPARFALFAVVAVAACLLLSCRFFRRFCLIVVGPLALALALATAFFLLESQSAF